MSEISCKNRLLKFFYVLPLQRAFLQETLTELKKHTRQAFLVRNQSIFLRCLSLKHRYKINTLLMLFLVYATEMKGITRCKLTIISE